MPELTDLLNERWQVISRDRVWKDVDSDTHITYGYDGRDISYSVYKVIFDSKGCMSYEFFSKNDIVLRFDTFDDAAKTALKLNDV